LRQELAVLDLGDGVRDTVLFGHAPPNLPGAGRDLGAHDRSQAFDEPPRVELGERRTARWIFAPSFSGVK
jgi:hypothetical protein